MHCLEKQRSSRFPTVEEMAIALLPFAPKRSAVSVERITGVTTGRNPRGALQTVAIKPGAQANASTTGAEHAVGAGTQASWGNTATSKPQRPLLWVGLAAAVVVVAGGGVALKLSHGDVQASANGSISAAPPASPAPSPPAPALEPPPAPPQLAGAASAEHDVAAAPPPSASTKTATPPAIAGRPKLPPPAIKPKPTGKTPGNDDPWGGQH